MDWNHSIRPHVEALGLFTLSQYVVFLPIFVPRCCHRHGYSKILTDLKHTEVLSTADVEHNYEQLTERELERTLISVACKRKALDNTVEQNLGDFCATTRFMYFTFPGVK